MTDLTRATVTCAVCGDRQTLLGSTWEVTVAIEVWAKTHSRAAHDGETAAVRVDRPKTRQGSAAPARWPRPTDR
jgi:ribosomal protein L31